MFLIEGKLKGFMIKLIKLSKLLLCLCILWLEEGFPFELKLVMLLSYPFKNDLDRLLDFYFDLFQISKSKVSLIYYDEFMALVDVKLGQQVSVAKQLLPLLDTRLIEANHVVPRRIHWCLCIIINENHFLPPKYRLNSIKSFKHKI